MILGVASRVVPILAGVDSSRVSSLWGPFILLNGDAPGAWCCKSSLTSFLAWLFHWSE
jgi:hypothetical protein